MSTLPGDRHQANIGNVAQGSIVVDSDSPWVSNDRRRIANSPTIPWLPMETQQAGPMEWHDTPSGSEMGGQAQYANTYYCYGISYGSLGSILFEKEKIWSELDQVYKRCLCSFCVAHFKRRKGYRAVTATSSEIPSVWIDHISGIEEPILKWAIDCGAVLQIDMVHPTVKGAENFHYQIWPVDQTATWIAAFGVGVNHKHQWRMVKLNARQLAIKEGIQESEKSLVEMAPIFWPWQVNPVQIH